MTTDQKIHAAYVQAVENNASVCHYTSFEDGYLALLNGLLPTGNYAVASVSGSTKQMAPTYMLPYGVTKP